MADQTYVEIVKGAVKDIFDNQFKANAAKSMDKAAEAAVK